MFPRWIAGRGPVPGGLCQLDCECHQTRIASSTARLKNAINAAPPSRPSFLTVSRSSESGSPACRDLQISIRASFLTTIWLVLGSAARRLQARRPTAGSNCDSRWRFPSNRYAGIGTAHFSSLESENVRESIGFGTGKKGRKRPDNHFGCTPPLSTTSAPTGSASRCRQESRAQRVGAGDCFHSTIAPRGCFWGAGSGAMANAAHSADRADLPRQMRHGVLFEGSAGSSTRVHVRVRSEWLSARR